MAMTVCSYERGKWQGWGKQSGSTNQSFINVLLKNLPSLVPSFSELIQSWTVTTPPVQQNSAVTLFPCWCALFPQSEEVTEKCGDRVSNNPPVLCSLPAQMLPMQNGWWVIVWPQSAAKEENKKTGRGEVLAHLSYLLGSASWVPVFYRVLNISWESRTF